MYLKKAIYRNVGPIKNLEIDFSFSDDGSPKPMILVGENGTGKSTVLSNIVDSFYEMAGTAFKNAREHDEDTEYQYYKAISPAEIHIGSDYMFSFLSYESEKDCRYINKSGNVLFDDLKREFDLPDTFKWDLLENKKMCTLSKKDSEEVWRNNIICYYAPSRYEKPFWMGSQYFDINEYAHPEVKSKWAGKLYTPITIENVTAKNLQWLLDVIADSRADIETKPDGTMSIEHVSVSDLQLLRNARTNIERIMSTILGQKIYFGLNYRSSNVSRFNIMKYEDNSVLCPTLDSLSTGQIALFNMFTTIVRYADMNDINKSIHLSSIRGIVVIDEIELHLHTKLQKEILPELIKLFPGIQFIVTTHAPLFLLGMKETFGDRSFDVIELPSGERIEVEDFGEFNKAYEYIKRTNTYQQEVDKVINQLNKKEKTMLITEGATDWKHMKAAWERIKKDERYSEKFKDLDFEFLKFSSPSSDEQTVFKTEMGDKTLLKICESYSKLPHSNKYVFIADNDNDSISAKMSGNDSLYKTWDNNVYSFTLPVPESRKETPNICIEHLYSDDEIKTEWKEHGIARRLYIGNEFDDRGIASDIDRVCEKKTVCGKESIAIIEGATGERVTSIKNENDINYAMSKSKFAKLIFDTTPPFNNFNVDNFVMIFETIQKIVDE